MMPTILHDPLSGVGLYSKRCYNSGMFLRGELLHGVMLETGTTQSELSRISGVRQPSISQFISGMYPASFIHVQ